MLIIDLDGARFGLDAMRVCESLWLPELTPIEEAPHYIVGMFSLRDQLVPVTDLNLRFGHPARPYSLSDQVVVLKEDQKLMGLIVSEVCEVVELAVETVQPAAQFGGEADCSAHLIRGEARIADEIVTLLDIDKLLSFQEGPSHAEHPALRFCPEATPEQHAVFRARAKALHDSVAEEDSSHLALAVIELSGEYFGIELKTVQEFCGISNPSPIPCCPPHILGAISLRGNLLILLDLHAALHLPHAVHNNGKVVVCRLGEQLVGMAVDDVHDVVYLRQEALQAAPETLYEHGAEIQGAAAYADKMMMVLDLPALLAREEWIVNENV
jgi:purine-binding chemotaxis protein CheW